MDRLEKNKHKKVYINAVKELYRDNQAFVKEGNKISAPITQTK